MLMYADVCYACRLADAECSDMGVLLAGRSMPVDTSTSVDACGVFHNIITLAAAVQCC